MEAKRQAECKLRSELMEDELLQWRQEVDAYQRHSMNKAEETAQVGPCNIKVQVGFWLVYRARPFLACSTSARKGLAR